MPIKLDDQTFAFKADGASTHLRLVWDSGFRAKASTAVDNVQKLFDTEALRLIEPYVPFRTGMLARSATHASKIGKGVIIHSTPYARYRYYLHASGSDLKGKRGSYWGQRFVADNKEHLHHFASEAMRKELE